MYGVSRKGFLEKLSFTSREHVLTQPFKKKFIYLVKIIIKHLNIIVAFTLTINIIMFGIFIVTTY